MTPPLARARTAESAGLFTRIGDQRAVGYCLVAQGDCLIRDSFPADAIPLLREGMGIFDALPERWGLLYGTSLLAMAAAALGDWPQVVTLLGVIDTLSERISGQLFPQIQAVIDEIAAQAERAARPGRAGQPRCRTGDRPRRPDHRCAVARPCSAARQPAAGGGLPLTRREREVAELIAQGLTNRQIGARLFIAERTVDTHVSRILAKLGCSSRAQVAAIVATSAPTPAPE